MVRAQRTLVIGVGLATFAASYVLGTTHAAPRPPDHLVIVVLDSVRADAAGVWGQTLPTTQSINDLAESALVFQDAHTPTLGSTSTYTSIWGSTYPETSGVGHNATAFCTNDTFDLLPTTFQRAGFHTEALVNTDGMRPDLGYRRGFDDWNGTPVDRVSQKPRAIRLNYRELKRSLKTLFARWNPSERQLLYVHLNGASLPLEPSWEARRRMELKGESFEPLRGADIRAYNDLAAVGELDPAIQERVRLTYLASVSDADRRVRLVLDALEQEGRREDTALVVVGNHGVMLWEDGAFGTGSSDAIGASHVPLIIRAPGVTPGVAPQTFSLVDLAPTLTALMGIDPPDTWRGHAVELTQEAASGGAYVQYRDRHAWVDNGMTQTWTNDRPADLGAHAQRVLSNLTPRTTPAANRACKATAK